MKNNDVNNKPTIILILGSVFTIFGIIAIILFCLQNPVPWLGVAISVILLLLGPILLAVGIMRSKVLKDMTKLLHDPNAHVTTAKFISAKVSSYTSSSFGVGGISVPTSMNVYRKVIYSYNDENGVSHTATSQLSYFNNQIEYLKEKQNFSIKCKGKLSVITEKLPENNERFNL